MSERLTFQQVAPILSAIADTDVVLIGGQALAFWCFHYRDRAAELQDPQVISSKDIDLQGDREALMTVAKRLASAALLPSPDTQDVTNAGAVRVSLGGAQRDVQMLLSPYGVRAEQARKTAIPIELPDGSRVRVLHPVLCMESRLANVSGLGRTDARSLAQARASVVCARELIRDLAATGKIREALDLCERVFRYARSNIHARSVRREHGIDAFEAVQPLRELPEAFRSERYPRMVARLGRG